MKTFPRFILFSFLVAVVALTGGHIGPTSAMAAGLSSAQAPGAYAVDVQVSPVPAGTAWKYTITKTTSDAKDLGHFIINFGNCGDQSPTIANVVSATVNGVGWLDQLESTEGKTGCNIDSVNFVKFDNLPAANSYVIEFTLNDTYPLMDSTGWLKHGTTCERIAMQGPGCKGLHPFDGDGCGCFPRRQAEHRHQYLHAPLWLRLHRKSELHRRLRRRHQRRSRRG